MDKERILLSLYSRDMVDVIIEFFQPNFTKVWEELKNSRALLHQLSYKVNCCQHNVKLYHRHTALDHIKQLTLMINDFKTELLLIGT